MAQTFPHDLSPGEQVPDIRPAVAHHEFVPSPALFFVTLNYLHKSIDVMPSNMGQVSRVPAVASLPGLPK